NITNAGTYNGATIASSSFNGVTIGSGLVDGIDVSAMDTAYKAADKALQDRATTLETKTGGVSRSGILTGTDTGTTTIEGSTSISKAGGVATNKVTVSGATTTTLENGKLTVGAATVQNIGFSIGNSSLNGGALTLDTDNVWRTTTGITATKGTIGGVTLSGNDITLSGKVDGVDVSELAKQVGSGSTDTGTIAANTGGVTRSGILTGTDTGTTTIEGNTSISKDSGVTTNKVTVGAAVADQTIIDKGSVTAKTVTTGKSELSDSGLIVDTKTKVQSGLVQADATHKLDTAGLTVGTNTLTDTALTVGKFSVTAADGSLSAANGGFKVGGDGNLSIGSGKFTVAADGAVTGGTYNDVAINKKGGSGSDVMVGGINLTQLSSSTGTNLGGIERAADADAGGKHITTVEGQLSVYETGKIANTDNKFVVDGDKVTVGAAAADQTVIEKGSVTAKIVTVGKSELSDSGLAVDTKTKVQSGLVQADAAHKLDTAGLTVGTNTLTDTALTIGGTEIVDKQVKVGQNTLTDTALTIGTSVVTDGQLQVDGKSKMTKDGFIVSDTADSETQLTADSLILNGQELTSANIEGLNKVTLDGDDVKIGAGFKVNKDDGSFSAAGGNFAVAADGAATIGAAGTQTVIANDKVTVGSAAADQTVIDKGSVTTGSSKLDAEGLHVGDATSGDSYGYLTNNGVLNIFSKEYSKSHLTGDGAYIDKTIINGNTIRTGALEVDRLTVNGQVYTGHVSDGHLQFGNDGSIVNNIYDKKADGSKYITHFQTNVNDGTEGDLSKWGENKGVMMAVFDKEGATEDTIADMTFKDSTTGAYLGVQENGLQTVVKNQWNAKEGDVSGESATSGQRLLLTQSHDGQVIHVEDRDNDTGSVVETGSTVFRVSGIEKMGSETAADTLQEYFAVDTTSGIVSFSVAGSDGTALQTTIKGNAITTGMVNGVTIAAGDDAIKFGIDGVADSVVNVTEMSQRLANLEGTIGEDGTVKALNTVGIEHGGSVGTANSTTTIEGSTVIKESGVAIKGSLAVNGVSTFGTAADGTTTIKNNIITTGTVNADSFEQGGKALDQVFAAKDYVSGELKTVSDGLNDVNTALADKVGSADFTNLSNTVTGLGSTVTELDGRTTAVKYTGGVTSIGDVGISGSNVELGSINGIGIAKADGDTNLTIGGVKLSELGGNTNAIKGLQQDVKDIQDALTNPDGSKPEISIELSNTKGITREIQNAGAADEYGVTTIETNTRISQFGLTTNVLTAGEGSIGGVKFAGGKVSGVSAINGVGVAGDAVSNLTIGDVKLSDVNTLKKDVEELKKNGTGGSGTAVETENVKGIKRNGVSGDYGTTTIEGSLAVSRDGAALTGSLNVSGDAAFGSGSSQTTIAGSSIVTGTVNATTELKEQGVSLNEKYAAKGAYDDAFKDMNAALVDKAEQSDMTIVQNRLDRWDSSLSGWDSKLAGVTASTTNISYDKATGVTSVSGVGFSGNGLMSGVTELNGVAIGSHNDNLSIGGVNLSELGGMSGDVSSLGNRVTDLEANAKWTEGGVPVVLDHTKGLTRKVDTYEDDGTTAKTFTTTIEGNTAISQSGIVTNNITAAAGSVGGVVFKSGAVSGVASLNGVTVSGNAASGLTIGGVSLSGLDTDVDTLQKDVEDLKKNGTGGGTAVETANVKGIKRTGVSGDYGTTTIEGSTVIDKDGARITGTLKATGAVTLGSGGEVVNISGGEVTASGSINAAGGLKEYGVKLEDKYLQGGDVYTRSQTYNQTEIDDMTGKLQREKASLTSVTELGDQVGVLTDKTAGISFSSGVTTIGSVNVSGSNISGVSDLGVASINGVGISKAEGDNNLTIGGVSLSKLGYLSTDITGIKGDIKDLQNAAFGSDTVIEMSNTKGIVRDTTTAGSEVTTIEGNTHISKNGLQTSSLQADKATIGGVNIAGGAITGATFNGAVISGSKFNGIDVGALQSSVSQLGDRVTKIETEGAPGGSGGGSSENTAGIKRPGSGETTIETNTTITGSGVTTNNITAGDSITVAGTSENKTTIDKDGIVVAEGQTNQVTINKDGIHVGANSSVVNDVDGFITDKGLYIGVSSSGNTDSAKFSVDKSSGTMTSKVGDYTFTNGSGGAVFKNSGSSAKEYGESSTAPKYTDTSIKGNEIHTGQLNANELILDGSKVNVEHKGNSDILADQAINNTVKGSGDNATHFETNGDGGVTSEVTDGKNTVVNNTNASGTSITKYKVGKDSDGNATRTEVGRTDINGDSLTVSKMSTTTEKDADGNEKEVTKTVSSTTVGSGEVTLHREDGSTIRVGEAIEGMQDQIQDIGSKVNEMGVEIKEVGALSAALAGLHPQPENANSRADFAMAMGSYEGKQALAVGGFYRPDKRTMLSIGASTTSSKHMMNMGISIALDKLPEAERKEQESNTDLAARMKKLEAEYEARLEKMEAAYEARMERLEARYARLQEAAASEQPAVKTEPVPTADQAAEMRKAEAAKKAAEAEKVAAAKKAEEVKKAEEAKKAEELKKAEAAKKAAEAEKVAAAKKAAEVKKAEEAKKAEEVKKAEAAKKAAEAEKIAAAKKAAEVKKAEEAKKAEELKKAETAKKVVKAKPAAGEQKAAAAAKPQQAAAERSAGVSVLNRDFSYGGRDSSVRTK
ncbi:YadA-like family protein, partial [Phascolarctobacterium sp.]